MNYFDGCANLSEAKARRNELMREFHPDNLTRITQEVNAAYAQVQRDARADGTLPASYQVRPVQPVMQAALPSHDARCRICGKRLFTEWDFDHGMHGYCDAAERHGTLGQPRERVQLPPMTRYSFPVANTTAHDWQDTDEKAELKSGETRDW